MRVFFTILGISLLLSHPFTLGQAQELRFFRIGTGGIAGTYYPIGGMIAHAISNPPGSIPCDDDANCGPPGLILIAQSANGSVANVKDIQSGRLESGFVQSDIAFWAYTGSGTFAGEPPKQALRAIANLYPESIHIVAHKNAGIRRVKDLLGKRVSLDELGSGTLIDAELVLSAYGISKDDLDIEYMKAANAIERIRSGQLDAFFVVAGYPARSISELASDTDIVLVPIDGPEANNLVAQYRFFTRDSIPADVYPGIAAAETVSVGAQWLVASSVDEETVYQITRSLWNHNSRRLLDSGHVKGKHISLQTALDGVAVPLHPGSRRYYAEMGMMSE
jgi:hypothetical protein